MDNAQWVPFYEALADKLLAYNDKRSELFELIKKVASEQPLMNPYSDAVSKTDIRYASDDNVKVDVTFVDLKNADGSISKLLAEVC